MTSADQPAYAENGRLVLREMVSLPDVLDLLIVGAGPLGTAAAFRAKELGVSALVVDHDDILKRIRDYAKDKLILPDYGGGDRMPFPEGGALIEALHFEPIDKDELCRRWKALYREHCVPAAIGVELTGLRRGSDAWVATVMNHNLKREEELKARHVVIAVGRGVPRQLEVQGDLTGLSFAMTDATRFVGRPACVIGGGTSAAEAVIAISQAKATASDATEVYWSHRGQKMPKVSQALAEVFFSAFTGHGNIRYLPASDPVAVTGTGPDGCLAIRTARVSVDSQPTSVTLLEFAKSATVACIGEDVPEAFLKRIGIPLVENDQGKKRAHVTPLLETKQPDVYLAGDILSPMYIECTDFDDPAKQTEIRRRGNIKAAMRDGVLVADVVAQKLAGRQVIRVPLVPEPPAPDRPSAVPVPPEPNLGCRLVNILPTGVEAGEFVIRANGTTRIGREGAEIAFPLDENLSERHAEIIGAAGRYSIRDAGSRGGTYLRPNPSRAVPITAPTLILAGRQWFMIANQATPEVVHYEASGQIAARFAISKATVIVGRESPDFTVAATDRSLSRRHFAVQLKDGQLLVRDLGSANGTLIKVDAELPVDDGDHILVGQQQLRFVREALQQAPAPVVEFDPTTTYRGRKLPVPAAAPAVAPSAAPKEPALDKGVEPSVQFVGRQGRVACTRKDALCDVATAAGLVLEADCHQGACGMDPIEIVAGGEFLNPTGRAEKDTLEDLCGLDPATHRLACMARATGPVTVRILPKK